MHNQALLFKTFVLIWNKKTIIDKFNLLTSLAKLCLANSFVSLVCGDEHEKHYIFECEQFIQGHYLVHPIHSFNIEAQRVLASLALALLVFSLLKVATAVSSWDTVAPAELL